MPSEYRCSTRSMNSWVRALVCDASVTISTIRATTKSAAEERTRTVSVPVPFSVPANTSSPGSFAAGSGSPVMVAWSTSLAPAVTWPSAAIRSPGLTRIMSPAWSSAASTGSSAPSGAEPDGAVRGQVEQPPHGLLGVMGGDRLERPRGREDDDQQAAVQDLPNRGRADRGGDHEQVHVQHPPPQCPQPGQRGLPAARRVAGEEQRPPQPGRAVRQPGGQPGQEQDGRGAGPPHPGQRPRGRGCDPGLGSRARVTFPGGQHGCHRFSVGRPTCSSEYLFR